MDERAVMTAADLEALKAEIERLETGEREAIAARIKTAREWGDLKENSEYHDAKNDQAHLETKIRVLRDRLLRAEVREAPEGGGDVVAFGSCVEVRDEGTGKTHAYTLVSRIDADAAAGKIPFESPIAKALEGSRVGDEVAVSTPRGDRRLTVLGIT